MKNRPPCSFCGREPPETQKLICGLRDGAAICDSCIHDAHELTAVAGASTLPPTARRDVLDHGYVELVESWGSDERIIEAARMSTNKGFNGWGTLCKAHSHPVDSCLDCRADDAARMLGTQSGDEKLLAFLWKNKHATPFEMAGATFEVCAPIFVFREWHRHRTQSYNEMSARYTPLPDVNYIPSIERLMLGSDGKNKQAGTVNDAPALSENQAVYFQGELRRIYDDAQNVYQRALNSGVPKELARVHLPVGRYSRMRASTDLRNWLGFVRLRSAPNAQWEIRMFSNVVADFLRSLFPRTMALFDEELAAA